MRKEDFLLKKISRITERVFQKILKNYGIVDLNPAQFRILYILWGNDNITITELAKETSLEKTTLTSMLDRLEQTGNIVKKKDDKDKRKTRILLSSNSKQLEKIYELAIEEIKSICLNGLSPADDKILRGYMEIVLDNLLRYEVEHNSANEIS